MTRSQRQYLLRDEGGGWGVVQDGGCLGREGRQGLVVR